MKLLGILRFELGYQLRRPWPWLSLAVLTVFALLSTRSAIVPVTLPEDFILNSPFIITTATVFSCQVWLLVAPPVAGEAAARDVHTGMYPLLYTTPVRKLEYLGGRFLAAVILHAAILLEAEPLGAMSELRGRIWRRVIPKAELAAVERAHAVISTKLLAGRSVVRVHGDAVPGAGFEPAEPDLEDVYFSAMAGRIGRRREQTEPVGTP